MYLLVTAGLACIGFLSYLNINTYIADVQVRQGNTEIAHDGPGMDVEEYLRR